MRHRDGNIDDELRFHLAERIDDLVASGMSRSAAKRQAEIEFGGLAQTKEAILDQRPWRVADSLAQDLRYAWRSLRHWPVFSIATIVVVALGIAAATTIFAVVNASLFRPLPLERPAELVSVWRTAPGNPREPAYFDSYRDYLILATHNHSVTGLAATFEQNYVVTGAGEPHRVAGGIATGNLFTVVGGRAAIGRLFQPNDVRSEPSCVISYAFWQSQFGGARDAVGRIIRLNDRPYRVLGVLAERFSLRVLERPFETAVWTLILEGDAGHTTTSLAPVAVIGRLKPRVTPSQAEADFSNIQQGVNRQYADEPPGGMLVAGLQQDNTRTVHTTLLVLLAAVGVVLLIACVNAGSLILGRHIQRTHEFAVRLALGCSLARLLQQLTTEVLLLFTCGGVLGVTIAWMLVRVFVALNPLGVLPPGGVSIGGSGAAAAVLAICITTVLFGSLPAFRGLRRLDVDALRAHTATTRRSYLRSRLSGVAIQIALSVVLVVTAGLLISTFATIAAQRLGFDTQHVYVTDVALPESRFPTVEAQTRFADGVLRQLRALPSVQAAAISASWPFQANGQHPIDVDGHETMLEQAPQAFLFLIGANYFDALDVPVLRGREFANTDRPSTLPVAVINSAMAQRAFPGVDPLGQRIRIRYPGKEEPTEPWLTIVGVVSNTRSQRYNHIDWDEAPAVYSDLDQRHDATAADRFETQTLYIYVRAQSLFATTLASAVHAVDPDLPTGAIRSTGEIVRSLQAQPRLRASVIGGFAVLTLALTIVGIYGVMAQFVALRRREIGIRIALGASRADVMRLIMKCTLVLVSSGVAVGIVGALAAGRFVSAALYGVSTGDARTFGIAIVTITLVSFVASYLPTRSATRINPSVTLRYD